MDRCSDTAGFLSMLHHLNDPADEDADPPELPERLAAKSLFRWEVSPAANLPPFAVLMFCGICAGFCMHRGTRGCGSCTVFCRFLHVCPLYQHSVRAERSPDQHSALYLSTMLSAECTAQHNAECSALSDMRTFSLCGRKDHVCRSKVVVAALLDHIKYLPGI